MCQLLNLKRMHHQLAPINVDLISCKICFLLACVADKKDIPFRRESILRKKSPK